MKPELLIYAVIAAYFVYGRRKDIQIPPRLEIAQAGLVLMVLSTAVTTFLWAINIVKR